MKQMISLINVQMINPAAFRRLCVETLINYSNILINLPAAFRRLCVETS